MFRLTSKVPEMYDYDDLIVKSLMTFVPDAIILTGRAFPLEVLSVLSQTILR